MKIQTTTKKFRDGIKLSSKTGSEIQWESTGHLSVRLLDASGSFPLVARPVIVDIPGEGKVTLETDDRGAIFHPDVPFQDYELDLGDKITVHAPAVANRDDVQERHAPGVVFACIRVLVRDTDGLPCADAKLAVTGPDGAVVEVWTDARGYAEHADALPPGSPGSYKFAADAGTAAVELTGPGGGMTFVTLQEPV